MKTPSTTLHPVRQAQWDDMDWRDVPVFIINRNRLDAMRTLIDWLLKAGMRRIVIMDNQSKYPPLLKYYEALPEGVRLLLMDDNHGPYVLWQQDVHEMLDTPYIVTDSDLVPADFCPSDLVPLLLKTLQRFPNAGKVGPGLRIDNLTDVYREVETVRRWETQFWEQPLGEGCFAAPIDTTFALYPPRTEFSCDDRNVRLGYPYMLEHTPWYVDDARLSDEEVFYRANTSPVFSHWSVGRTDTRVARSERVADYDRRPKVLHLGGGHEHVFSWINADADGRLLDFRFDPTRCTPGSLTLPDNTLDGIYMESSFTWVNDPYALLSELYRTAKPAARLTIRLPHGHSDAALGDPRTRKAYVESSFDHFAQTSRQRHPRDYRADWQVRSIELDVSHELAAMEPNDALVWLRERRNCVRSMLVTLEAIKPARNALLDPIVPAQLHISGQPRLVPHFVVSNSPAVEPIAPADAASADAALRRVANAFEF
jgi:SAM-dependent methyltransferase